MNDQKTIPPSDEVGDLKEQCAALRTQTTKLQIALLVAVIMLAGFFWLEVKRNGQALKVLRPQFVQVVEASKNLDSAIQNISTKLAEYGRTHPDFVPILNKYRIPVTNAAAPATATAPKPAAAPAPKK